MKRITLWLLSTVAALVVLFSYRTSTGAAGGVPSAAPAPAAGGTGAGTTYRGSEVQTRWGPIQVTITVAAGKITDVAVPVYPDENRRDEEINAYALPALRQATLTAQSADVDSISGATVTSDGYRESLQAAIDAAQL